MIIDYLYYCFFYATSCSRINSKGRGAQYARHSPFVVQCYVALFFIEGGVEGIKVFAVKLILHNAQPLAEAYKMDTVILYPPLNFDGVTCGMDYLDKLVNRAAFVLKAEFLPAGEVVTNFGIISILPQLQFGDLFSKRLLFCI